MDDDTWHLVKHTSKVTGFVGGAKNRPSPISEAEVMKIVNQMQEGVEKPRPKVQWEVGELVRVKEGPFTDFNGAVEDVNYDKSKVRVSVTIFGRATAGRARLLAGREGLMRRQARADADPSCSRPVAAGDETPARGAQVTSPSRLNSTTRAWRVGVELER